MAKPWSLFTVLLIRRKRAKVNGIHGFDNNNKAIPVVFRVPQHTIQNQKWDIQTCIYIFVHKFHQCIVWCDLRRFFPKSTWYCSSAFFPNYLFLHSLQTEEFNETKSNVLGIEDRFRGRLRARQDHKVQEPSRKRWDVSHLTKPTWRVTTIFLSRRNIQNSVLQTVAITRAAQHCWNTLDQLKWSRTAIIGREWKKAKRRFWVEECKVKHKWLQLWRGIFPTWSTWSKTRY